MMKKQVDIETEKKVIQEPSLLIIIVLLLLNRQIGKKGRKKHEKN